ncbi:tRNA lysidine(34) synthetase TilS [Metamycoplasma neophronis]|uniref:tRNA(Ile)-lysidine synthase n=1 Tax=Metamycoplasma neophronis TaxID=872983 RepID=A0ABY2Z0Q3_9BACT|nr:tRNA lysidine(34) synthetase TilS [Metamycoplasma neophronis]TPR53866.1 tRNA lysidine(34) synthetase TilS [Metamycoplasma neophronis]
MQEHLIKKYESLLAKVKFEFQKHNIGIKQKMLIGVSGGPDSMWLLYLLKDYDVVVACVNYNKRFDSHYDASLVKLFCEENNIPCEILSLDHKENANGNFQAIAREERYLFYKEIYQKYNCSLLLLAHQKDDFLETAIMQKESSRETLHFGIKHINYVYQMNIFRPMLSLFWKQEIIDLCNEFSILFATDYTNKMPTYTRNKIRANLLHFSNQWKQNLYNEIMIENQANLIIEAKVINWYIEWKNQEFSCDWLDFNNPLIDKLIYFLINDKYKNINLTKGKIASIIDFLKSANRSSKYILDDENVLFKKKNHLIF